MYNQYTNQCFRKFFTSFTLCKEIDLKGALTPSSKTVFRFKHLIGLIQLHAGDGKLILLHIVEDLATRLKAEDDGTIETPHAAGRTLTYQRRGIVKELLVSYREKDLYYFTSHI